jgi:L-malate glycosyltransferase
MVKILVISHYSTFHVVRPEAEIFIGLAKQGFDVHIMTSEESDYTRIFRESGIHVTIFHPAKKNDANEIKVIRDYIIFHNIQIIQLFNNKAILAGIQAAKGLAVKVVLYRGYSGNINWWNPIDYLKFLHPRVDKIICNSQGVEEVIQRNMLCKSSKNKTITINKGHRAEWYESVKAIDIRKELGIPEDAFILVNMANDRRMKGIPFLLKAMKFVPEDANIHLLLVGGGMDKEKYLKIIRENSHPERIHILGHRKDALSIVAASDVFVLASIKGESITKSVIEAMSLGITPLITDIAGNRELVVNGESGIVVSSKCQYSLLHGIMALRNEPELCKKMGQNAKQHIATNLNADDTITKYKSFYESLLQ